MGLRISNSAVVVLLQKNPYNQRFVQSGSINKLMEDDDCTVNFSLFLLMPGQIQLPSRKTKLAEKPPSLTQSHDCNFFNPIKDQKIIQEKHCVWRIYAGGC